jgi:hypothetical protein
VKHGYNGNGRRTDEANYKSMTVGLGAAISGQPDLFESEHAGAQGG